MDIIPAIDLRGGNVVRLYQGDYEQETVFSDDPLGVAQRWQAEGGQRLHIVDLDGAHTGNPANLVAIAAITGSLTIPVQVGGGIRSAETAAGLFDAGADRVVVGTAAVSNPQLVEELCRRFGSERVVVALDARDGLVAIRGWTETSEITATDLAARMADLGVQRLLYTDISRDGTLEEPNYAATADLVRDSGLHVLSAGGVGAPEHVARLGANGSRGCHHRARPLHRRRHHRGGFGSRQRAIADRHLPRLPRWAVSTGAWLRRSRRRRHRRRPPVSRRVGPDIPAAAPAAPRTWHPNRPAALPSG